ncbi:MAG: NUDIX domain-containing protein [Patescibacteria group bacterium]|nr:NUDIX domain-containing protein [Patescibacteria group bacterium]
MELLLEITDKDTNNGEIERFDKPYRLRKAVRGVVINDKNEIALEFVSKHNYHKLPGGGVEDHETIEQALRREVREEAGCEIEIGDAIGIIIEYRNKIDKLQINYCYLAKIRGELSKPQFDKEEIENQFESLWVPIDQAIDFLEQDNPTTYDGKFIVKRDLTLLKKAKELILKS